MTTKLDLRTAKIVSHQRNIQRYAWLLATNLTDLERQYLHKRIAEEQAELERWTLQSPQPQREEALPSGVLTAQVLADGTSPVKNDSGAAGSA